MARIGEEVEIKAFQKQVKGEKYICQLAAVRWSAGWDDKMLSEQNATAGGEEEVSRFLLPEISPG